MSLSPWPGLTEFGPPVIQADGAPVGQQPNINFIGSSGVTDDPANQRVDVEVGGGGSGPTGPTGPTGATGPTGPTGPAGAGATPAGSDTQIQYNNSGAFGASSKFTWTEAGIALGLGEPGDTAYVQASSGGTDVNGGSIAVVTGDGTTNAAGDLYLTAGNSVDGNGGSIAVSSGNSTNASGGSFNFTAGYSETTGDGGNLEIYAGYSENGNGGDLRLFGGDSNDGAPGDIFLTTGLASGTSATGNLFFVNLPTSDPGVTGAIWVDTGAGNVLKMSP